MTVAIMLAASPNEAASGNVRYPLALAEVGDSSLLETVADNCAQLPVERFVVCFLLSDVRRFHLEEVCGQLGPHVKLFTVRRPTAGAACTALLAIDHIAPDGDLILINGNDLLRSDLRAIVEDFRARRLDAGTVVFPSLHPRYSYVKTGENGLVVETAEKNPISRRATAGIYWYARGQDFIDAAQSMIRKDAHVDGVFYVSPTFNEMLLQGKRVGVYEVSADAYMPLKDSEQFLTMRLLRR